MHKFCTTVGGKKIMPPHKQTVRQKLSSAKATDWLSYMKKLRTVRQKLSSAKTDLLSYMRNATSTKLSKKKGWHRGLGVLKISESYLSSLE
jgi:hypothetical protein